MPSTQHQNRCVKNKTNPKTKVKHVGFRVLKGREISKPIYNQGFQKHLVLPLIQQFIQSEMQDQGVSKE